MTETVVSVEWLADRLDDEDVRVVDVRDEWEFEGIGHVPGAASVPFDEFRSEGDASETHRDEDGDSEELRSSDHASGQSPRAEAVGAGDEGMLPGAAVWERLLSEAGIENDDLLVAYDDTHGVFAARFLVTAELYGHPIDRLRLLDGDYSAWSREREVGREAAAFEPGEYEARRPAESPLVGFEAVEAAVGSDAVIVDTREEWEYEEGHIPGAVRLDWRELVDDDTRGLKPREETEAILESRGIAPERRILLYCNTARRISHTYLVLRHLGYEELAFYEGSLTEWERRGGELETGE